MPTDIRILLIEDNRGDARLFEEFLKEHSTHKFTLTTVDTLDKGLKALTESEYDAVLLDMGLPDSTGLDTLKSVVQNNPGIPIVVITGLEDDKAGMEAVKLGAQEYLTKDEISERFLAKTILFAIERHRTEATLRKHQEQLHTTLDSIGDAVIATDRKGAITRMNPVAERLTGWSEDEALGLPLENVFKIINEKTRKTVANPVTKVLKEKTVVGLANHTLLITKDGREIPIADSGSPILNNDGTITGIVLVFRDQTKERAAQEALRQTVKDLKKSQKVAHVGSWKWYVQEDRLEWSDEMYNIFGISKKSFTGELSTVIQNAIHPEDQAAVYKSNESVTKNATPIPVEYRIIHTDGSIRHVWAEAGELLKDDAGNPYLLSGIVVDITQRKQIENSLRESQADYQDLFTHMLTGFAAHEIITDKDDKPVDFRFLDINPAFTEMTGLSRDIIGKTARQVIPGIEKDPADWIGRYGEIAQTCNAKTIVEYSEPLKKWFSISAYCPEAGKFATVFEDITRQKQASELVKKERNRAERYLDIAGNMFLAMDAEGTITMANRKCREILGYDNEEITGKNWFDTFIPERLREEIKAVSNQIIAGELESLAYYENPVLTKSGEERLIAWHNTDVWDDQGHIIGHLSSGEDITERRAAQKALEESERKLRTLLGNLQGMAYRCRMEANWSMQYVSEGSTLVCGYTPDDLVDNKTIAFADVIHPDDRQKVEEKVKKALEHKQHFELEYRIITKQGEERWVWERGSGIFMGDDVVALEGFINDITERKYAETQVKRQIVFTNTVLDAQTDTFFLFDPRTGKAERWNKAFRNVSGYTDDEIAALKAPDAYYSPQDVERAKEFISAGLTNGEEKIVLDLICKDGSVVPTEYAVSTIKNRETGKEYLISIGRNISERIEAERALRQSEERFELAMQAANDGLFDWNLVTNDIYFSPGWKFMLGYKDHELKNDFAEWERLTDPEDVKEAWQMHEELLAGERVRFEMELKMRHKDGHWIHILSRANLHRDEHGTPLRMIGTHTNISDRKKLEEQLRQTQKMEAIGKLAGGVAHDFNNLLTVINGYSEMILADISKDQMYYDKLQQINRAGKRASSLTRQLLAFSRKQMLKPVILNVDEQLLSIETMLQRLIGEDIDLVSYYGSKGALSKVDAGQLEQIIVNLVVNARDAMPNGGKLTIETENVYLDEQYARDHAEVEQNNYVCLSFTDNGVGMDRDTLQSVFEPFFTTKEFGKGTGLGLSTVYGIIKQSKGHVSVYSEKGKGTTFKIYLPIVEQTDRTEADGAEKNRTSVGSETILIVEDEDSVRDLIQVTLERYGYNILTAENGAAALDLVSSEETHIDLLITDVVMPNMSGKELVEQVTAQCPALKVCYMSGYTENAIVHHGVLDEDVNFIHKPFNTQQLANKIRTILDD